MYVEVYLQFCLPVMKAKYIVHENFRIVSIDSSISSRKNTMIKNILKEELPKLLFINI